MTESMKYEEYLDRYGSLTYANVGVSMLPMLREGKDLFTVVKKGPQRCKAGDVVLYRRGSHYILHRVIEVREKDYVILGDNCVNREYGITDDDILGVLTCFMRDGKTITVDDPAYKRYTAWMLKSVPVRTNVKKAMIKVKRGIRKVIR